MRMLRLCHVGSMFVVQVIAASITSNDQSPINSQLIKLRVEVEKLLI